MRAAIPLVLLALAALIGPRAHALCAMPPPDPVRLVAPVDHVARGGGIVIDLGTASGVAPRLSAGTPAREIPLALEPIALQLAVARIPADAPLGRASLLGVLPTPITLDVVADPLPPAIATAPSATLHRIDTPGPRGRGSAQFEARLTAAAPPGAIALVATWGDASTWSAIAAGTSLSLGYVGRCNSGGALASRGDHVTLAWLDAHGRRSLPSRPITVR